MGLLETLVIDLAYTWVRLFITLIISVLFSIAVGVAAARNKSAERVLLPFLDIGQTIPILGFFPVAIYLIVSVIPGYIGINFAVIFLLFTSMVWNIAFGVYESVKAIPQDLLDVADMQMKGWWSRLRTLYIPAAMPRIAYQSVISFSIGLFYLVTSEIFSTGSKLFSVTYGLGVVIAQLSLHTNLTTYVEVLVLFIAAVLLTRFLILSPFREYAEKFSFREEVSNRKSHALRIYSTVYYHLSKSASSVKFPQLKVPHEKRARAPHRKVIAKPQRSYVLPAIAVALFVIAAAYISAAGAMHYVPLVLAALAASFARVWGIYIICAAIALPLGIIIAKSTHGYEPALSALQVLAAIPAPIVFPIIIVLVFMLPFGGELAALIIIFIAEIWYLLFSVIAGMRTLPNQMLELKQTMRLGWYRAWKDIYVPAVMPAFVTGSITAIGGAWNSLIIAEYFSTQTAASTNLAQSVCGMALQVSATAVTQVGCGIGKVLDLAVFQGNFPLMVLSLLALTTMVVLINRIFWQRVYNKVTHRYKMAVTE